MEVIKLPYRMNNINRAIVLSRNNSCQTLQAVNLVDYGCQGRYLVAFLIYGSAFQPICHHFILLQFSVLAIIARASNSERDAIMSTLNLFFSRISGQQLEQSIPVLFDWLLRDKDDPRNLLQSVLSHEHLHNSKISKC